MVRILGGITYIPDFAIGKLDLEEVTCCIEDNLKDRYHLDFDKILSCINIEKVKLQQPTSYEINALSCSIERALKQNKLEKAKKLFEFAAIKLEILPDLSIYSNRTEVGKAQILELIVDKYDSIINNDKKYESLKKLLGRELSKLSSSCNAKEEDGQFLTKKAISGLLNKAPQLQKDLCNYKGVISNLLISSNINEEQPDHHSLLDIDDNTEITLIGDM